MGLPDSGFKSIIDGLKKSTEATPGHTFTGYRRKGPDEFVAVFTLAGSREHTVDKHTCEQIVQNANPGSETHEAAQKALKHWPSA